MQVRDKKEGQTGMSVLQEQRLMKRALELAAKGVGQVSPGPLVGCVIASPAGEVLGEGFYLYKDLKHAETYALEQAGARAKGPLPTFPSSLMRITVALLPALRR